MKKLLLVLAPLCLAASATAATVTVAGAGGDFTNIADAIAGTVAGDTIVVTDQGVYGAFAFSERTIVSNPAGASITATVIVEGGSGSIAVIDGFTFANIGNAIFLNGDGATAGTLTVSNCSFTNISSHGILLNAGEDATLFVDSSTFDSCGENGITLFRNATVTVTDSTMSNCGLGIGGHGAIFVDGNLSNATGRVITLDNTDVSGCLYGIRTFRRTDLSLVNGSTVSSSILDGVFIDGEAAGSSVTVTDSSVSGNGLRGMFLARGMSLDVSGSDVSNNSNDGIFLEDFVSSGVAPVISITDSTVTGNSGRGFFHFGKGNVDSTVTITDSTFSGNGNRQISAEAVPGSSTVLYNLARNFVVDGSSNAESAIIAFTAGAGSVMEANLVDGGAVCVATNLGSIALHNNTLVNASGAAVEVFDGGGQAIDIRNNIMAQSGDGVASGSGNGLAGTVIDHNLVDVAGDDFDPAYIVGANNITGQAAGFVSPSTTAGAGDYHLGLGSLARNAGDPGLVLASDIEGNPYAANPDMGAYSATGGSSSVIDWSVLD